MQKYPIIVIGGGHAGIEAALASSRLGVKTALVTIGKQQIGRMSCNPSVGGLAKSHIVSEVDALGGEIGVNADYTGIHYRTLNTRKGPAVQATRIQCDKNEYPARLQSIIETTDNLEIIDALVVGVDVKSDQVKGVTLEDGSKLAADSVIMAAGTFLGGRIYIGNWQQDAGRIEDRAAFELSQNLKDLGFRMERLKTGTPPRVHIESLDYSKMQIQEGDSPPPFFSRKAKKEYRLFHMEQSGMRLREDINMFHVEHKEKAFLHDLGRAQLPCYLTHTTERTHGIIAANLEKSALYGGVIEGRGVRYCPSIEDKIVKFPERSSHHVFIEPEGRNNCRIYPNGTSNSLPEEVQREMIGSIPGMERAEIIRPGYAIEYDFCDPVQLCHTLETGKVENLYFAGQVNGTTGYEEAAGQGFVAGVNAVMKLRGEKPIILSRSEAYIGVLIDDLVTKGTDEPYRMFTSRAEFRLTLRQGNAPFRLLGKARSLGLVESDVIRELDGIQANVDKEIERLASNFYNGASMAKMLRRPGVHYGDLPGRNNELTQEEIQLVETEVKYAGYIEREHNRIESMKEVDKQLIPKGIDYYKVPSLRRESREKLTRIQPENLGQASRISGVNPSDIAIISVYIKRWHQ